MPGAQKLDVPGYIDIGSETLQLHPADGHTADGMAIWMPWARVLVAGDYLSPVEIPMLSPGGSVSAYLATLNRLEPLVEQADHVVPGHGGAIDATQALAILREDRAYLQALERGEDAGAADRPPDQGPAGDPRDEPHAAMSRRSSVGVSTTST